MRFSYDSLRYPDEKRLRSVHFTDAVQRQIHVPGLPLQCTCSWKSRERVAASADIVYDSTCPTEVVNFNRLGRNEPYASRPIITMEGIA